MRLARREELAGVARFYADVGYGGGVAAGDVVLVAVDDASVIGAVRLCEEEGTLVLRGMYVSPSRQREGVGKALLAAADSRIGRRECWCVPHEWLRVFYAGARFHEASRAEAPAFLVARADGYAARGQSVILMRRPGELG